MYVSESVLLCITSTKSGAKGRVCASKFAQAEI